MDFTNDFFARNRLKGRGKGETLPRRRSSILSGRLAEKTASNGIAPVGVPAFETNTPLHALPGQHDGQQQVIEPLYLSALD